MARPGIAGIAAAALIALLAMGRGAGAGPLAAGTTEQPVAGRTAYVHVPARLPAGGARGLVLVLHGGLGNAGRIATQGAEHGLNLDALADQRGFVVAYLDGTRVSKVLGDTFLGWNAGGGCCGVPAGQGVDDVRYVADAAAELARRYGIDAHRVYGLGHSNGAMMLQRVACEAGVFAGVVAVAGPLNLAESTCPAARGRRVLAVHGEDDANVPVAGGVGPRGVSRVAFQPEVHSQALMQAAGADYQLLLVPGADHYLAHIDDVLARDGGQTVAQRAVTFFGL